MQQAEAARHVDARELRERGVDLPARDHRRDAAVRIRHEVMHRIARSLEHRAGLHDAAERRLRIGGLALQLVELDVLHPHIEPGFAACRRARRCGTVPLSLP